MPNSTTLKIEFSNVYRKRLKDTVDVSLRHMVLGNTNYRFQKQDASRLFSRKGFDFTQGGRYELTVTPNVHHGVRQFTRVLQNKTTSETLVFPVRAGKVQGIVAPGFNKLQVHLRTVLENSDVESFPALKGANLYNALDDPRKAGLLNLCAKMTETTFRLPTPRTVFSYVTGLTRLRGDRLFAKVDKALRDEVKNSQVYKLFHSESGSMHKPPPGYVLVDSYKSSERYGNLQLTFFNNPDTLDFIIDADIDDAQGIEHIFQVVDHKITSNQTNPYEIHEILLAHQQIDPGYTLVI